MSEDTSFQDLLRRVREGDQDAAVELVRSYEAAIRRVVRIRLIDSRLKGVLDSMDICQSVMASFFCRAALGQFDLQKPEDLVRLLVTMARNKLADQARRQATLPRSRFPAPIRPPAAWSRRASCSRRPGAGSAPRNAGWPNSAR